MTRTCFRFLCAGITALFLTLAACGTQAPQQEDEPTAEPLEDTAPGPSKMTTPESLPPADTETTVADKSGVRISIAAVGDMMLGTDYPQNHLPDDDGVAFLATVAPILSAADLTFGNLEGVLLDGGEPAKECSNPNACYLFRSPSRYAQHYKAAGFDVLSLANNHARDFGEDGRLSSMRTLAAAGIHHSGLSGDFASMEVNGLRVALLAYAVTINSNLLHDYELAANTIAAEAERHDIVVISFHGGAEGQNVTHLPFAEEEYFGEPRGDVVRFARLAVDAGADLVLGHGPHVVRAMEVYKDRLIAYSLGNFATYYGISVAGDKGVAPILVSTLDGTGRFVNGHIHSTVQVRPDGPSIDDSKRALQQLRSLSLEDFGTPGLRFEADGAIFPEQRVSISKQ